MFTVRVFLTFTLFATIAFALEDPPKVRYEWKYLNFTWESAEQYQESVENDEYTPKNNAIVGIKVWKDRMYLSVPRWRHGVPATLVTIPILPEDGNKSPNLQPYPNWDMQKSGDCKAFQSVKSMEIDPAGRMWIIDQGHHGFLDGIQNLCPPRLIILELALDGQIILDYSFPSDVVDSKTNLLNDIVLDESDGGYAYISNGDKNDPSIIVFSLDQKESWVFRDKSMKSTAPMFKVKNDNITVNSPYGVNGIALSPVSAEGEPVLYYTPLPSYEMFTIPTKVLKKNLQDFSSKVKLVGKKPSQSAGMIMDAGGVLYFGSLADNEVYKWDTNKPFITDNQEVVAKSDDELMWPDTFAIHQCGDMFVTSNKLEQFEVDKIDIGQVNFRVIYLGLLDYANYQYADNVLLPAACS